MMAKPGKWQSGSGLSLRQSVTLTAAFALLAVSVVLVTYAEIRSASQAHRHEAARLDVQADLMDTMLDLYRERLGALARRVAADPEVDAALLAGFASPEVSETLELAREQLPERPVLVLFTPDGQTLTDAAGGGADAIRPGVLPQGAAPGLETTMVVGADGAPVLAHYAPVRRGDRIVGSVGAFLPVSDRVEAFFPDLLGLAFLDADGGFRRLAGEFPDAAAATIGADSDGQAQSLILPDTETRRRLEATLLPLRHETQGAAGNLILLRDITEIIRREELLTRLAFTTVLVIIILSLGLLMRALRLGFRPLGAVVRLLDTMVKGETGLRFRGMEGGPQVWDAPPEGDTGEGAASDASSGREIDTLLDTVERFRASLDARNALIIVREQLASARRIQQSLLPVEFDLHPGLEVHGRMRAALEVGGDFFDTFPLKGDRVAVVIADVSGKGIAAALFAAQASALLRAHCLQSDDLAAVVRSANIALCERNPEDMFLTAILAVITPETGQVSFVSAGHCPPMIAGNDGVVRLVETEPEPVLGVLPDLTWTPHHLTLSPDDRMLFYSDGFDEAQTGDGVLLGTSGAMKMFQDACAGETDLSGERLSRLILDRIDAFAAGAPQSDDITLMVIGRAGDRAGA